MSEWNHDCDEGHEEVEKAMVEEEKLVKFLQAGDWRSLRTASQRQFAQEGNQHQAWKQSNAGNSSHRVVFRI